MEHPARCLIVLAAFATLLRVPILGRDKTQWFNLQSLQTDQKVTVTQTNGQNIKGRFREFSERSIIVQTRHAISPSSAPMSNGSLLVPV